MFYGCASLTSNPYLDFANLDNFLVIDLEGCNNLTLIDFNNIPLKKTSKILFPTTVSEVTGLNLLNPTEMTFKGLDNLTKVNQIWYNSNLQFGYWYYGGCKAPFETTFVGEIERIPSSDIKYVNCYRYGLRYMNEASKTSFVNALKDYNSGETATLYNAASYLSSAQIAIATAKNWTVT